MKRIALFAAIVLGSAMSYAEDFIGTYKCSGFDPYLNQHYSGTLNVEQQGA